MSRIKHPIFAAVALLFLGSASHPSAQSPQRPPPSPCCNSAKDLAALAAKQHPGQEWGYLSLQQLGEDFETASNGWTGVIKVPNAARDGAQIEVPVSSGSMNAKTHDFFRAVRGVLHRGQGQDGTDILEVTALQHEASRSGVAKPWMTIAGWVAIHQVVALIH
jgi:hypothetical protein